MNCPNWGRQHAGHKKAVKFKSALWWPPYDPSHSLSLLLHQVMEPEKRKSCHLYLVKEGDWLARNLYCLYISIDKFWCDADSVKQQLLAAGRSTIRFSTKVTSNSTRHWWRMTQRKTLYNEHDLSNSLSHLVFKETKIAVHQVLLCILPLPSTPRLTLHTHYGTKRTVMVWFRYERPNTPF